jgi:O-antigen/teichoic acid export membrane protein
LAGRIASVGVNALMLPVFSRIFPHPEEGFGLYLLAAIVTSLLANTAAAGLSLSVVRHAATHFAKDRPSAAEAVIRYALLMAGVFGSCVALAFYLAASFLPFDVFNDFRETQTCALISTWILLQALGLVLADTFRAFHDIRFAVLFGGLASNALAAASVGIVFVVSRQASLHLVLSLILVGWTISVAAGLVCLRQKLRALPRPAAEPPLTPFRRGLLAESLPLMLANVVPMATMQLDLWIVGWYFDDDKSQIGLYGAAWRLVALGSTALVLVNSVIAPMIAELHARHRMPALERLLRGTATVAGAPTLIAMLLMTFFAEPILGHYFGSGYRAAAPVLMILSSGYLFYAACGSTGITLMMCGHSKASMTIAVASLMLLLGSALLAVPYGITAVAAAAAGTMAFQNLATLFWVRWRLGIWTHVFIPPTVERLRTAFSFSSKNPAVEGS